MGLSTPPKLLCYRLYLPKISQVKLNKPINMNKYKENDNISWMILIVPLERKSNAMH
jgi:hypothetical protein